MKQIKATARYEYGDFLKPFQGLGGVLINAEPGRGNKMGEELYTLQTIKGLRYVYESEIESKMEIE